MKKIAIFASGTGSNFDVIAKEAVNGNIPCEVSVLVCDKQDAKVIEKAKKHKIRTFIFNPKHFKNKKSFELEILNILKENKVELIILAGYMRLIGTTLLENYPRRILNIHPSLLPNFKGKDAVGQAMDANVSVTGVTVHFVDAGMDTGEIIEQQSLNIEELHTREAIETEIHKIEHQLYPKVIKRVLEEMK